MRVQPHLPRSPLTATVIDACGAALCACSAANSPAPPEPRIRMSLRSSRTRGFGTLHQELRGQHDGDQTESDHVEQGFRIDEQHTGDEQHDALVGGGLLEQQPWNAPHSAMMPTAAVKVTSAIEPQSAFARVLVEPVRSSPVPL